MANKSKDYLKLKNSQKIIIKIYGILKLELKKYIHRKYTTNGFSTVLNS